MQGLLCWLWADKSVRAGKREAVTAKSLEGYMDGMEGRENGKISVRVGGQGKIVKAAETGACTFRAQIVGQG